MTKIDKKIVGYKVVENTPPPPAAVLLQRPDILTGRTYKLKTPLAEHALYVTINDLDGRPFEIFVNCKDMTNFQWVVALTRVMSAVFRHGGEVNFLIEELMSVMCPKGGYFYRGQYRASLVAEIGSILKDHLTGLGLYQPDNSLAEAAVAMVKEKAVTKSVSLPEPPPERSDFPPNAELCLHCNTKAAVLMDGCLTCLNCGQSKCG